CSKKCWLRRGSRQKAAGSRVPAKKAYFSVKERSAYIRPRTSSTAFVFGTSCVRKRSVLPSAASTAKNGSAERTSSPKYSKACGNAWHTGKPSVRRRNVLRKTVI